MSGDHESQDHKNSPAWISVLYPLGIGILLLLYALGQLTTLLGFDVALILAIASGYRVVYRAVHDLLNREFSADLAIVIAAVAAIAVREYFAAAEAMFIMLIGEEIEHFTIARVRGAIAGFVQMTPPVARVIRDGQEREISPEQVQEGDLVVVRAGERLPIDGMVVSGRSSIQESMVTGEPIPAQKQPGDRVYNGSLNESGVLEVRAEQVGTNTTLARIARLVAEAQKQKAPIERTADVYARYFLPIVLAAGGAIYYFTNDTLRAVAALIVACPCALVLATPAAMASAIARLAREGVLVKGGGIIEALARIGAVAFDKTGTLTEGNPQVHSVIAAPGYCEADVLALASGAERSSEHLLGRAIVEEARRRGVDVTDSRDLLIRPGLGVRATVREHEVCVGNLAFAREATQRNHEWTEETHAREAGTGQTLVVVVVDAAPAGILSLRDPLRSGARETVLELRGMGIERICMLTGDADSAAQYIGKQAGIDEIYSRLLPEDKAARIRNMRQEKMRVLMAGDGLNDAPSLASADVGLALGRGTADLSAEAAHVVLLKDCMRQIPALLAFARKVIRRIRLSILLFAFGINSLAILGAAFGYFGPAAAAIVHQSASLFAILSCALLLIEGKAIKESPLSKVLAAWELWTHPFRSAMSRRGLQRLAGQLSDHRGRILGWSTGILITTWILSGITLIGPDQAGVVQRLGRLADQLQPGLHYRLPWPVESVSRLSPGRIRVVEIGFRTNLGSAGPSPEPRVYEWNIQHRQGRYQKVADEGLMLTGDENLIEVNAVVQYDVRDPGSYLFNIADPEALLRTNAERSLRLSVAREPMDTTLDGGRTKIERAWKEELDASLAPFRSGMHVLSVRLQDVHPPLEVVEAFRDVASAAEEKSMRINEAEGYLREQVPLARGQSQARLLAAQAYTSARIDRSRGESARYLERESAYRRAPDLTSLRLYFEAIDQTLPNKPKFIVDLNKLNRRRFVFLDLKDLSLLNLIEPKNAPTK